MEAFSHSTHNSNHNNHNNSILLVDDEKDILNLFCDCLQKFDYETIPFNNPIDALNYINTSNISNCSLIITDYASNVWYRFDKENKRKRFYPVRYSCNYK
jgi:response regulator RpfG family c-di-GMP phosphodiesterase